jgi:hypothetical protein
LFDEHEINPDQRHPRGQVHRDAVVRQMPTKPGDG